ncbi:hypothetical protein G3576_27955 [Roseomonas stagni]|uniref:HPF/RaiA family ribosome-associated protein n=1 Tax=Falsiroseomonas algicola TaxID=2716930 RepID=A0A6M1LV37_9PROT|nr:hypothetical protein [Falsiroseomonas algicola]NGM23872.1 hypothetical protein [Falsiroseomonas algicola]
MPEKHPNTIRWGGPGASHEDATKPMPEPGPAHPEDAVSTNPSVSQRSGGGGERDAKHSHVDPMRSSKSHATDGASPSETDRAFRENRSRRDRAADAEAAQDAPEEDDGDDEAEPAEEEAEGVNLPVLLNTDSSVQGTERLAARTERLVRARLRHLAPHLTRVEAFITDASRGSQGARDLRCALEARPVNARPVSADHSAATAEEAVRGAAGKLARLLRTQLGRRRDVKGAETIRTMES